MRAGRPRLGRAGLAATVPRAGGNGSQGQARRGRRRTMNKQGAGLGFIGLGIMGRPMAGHLIAAGHQVFLHTRSGVPQELAGKGGKACASAKVVAQSADVIFTMVPDTPDVERVLLGENGVASGLSRGKTVVDMSSISPIETKRFAQEINRLDCDYPDAPGSGGEVGAKGASLTIMVGGPQAAFDR